MKHYIGYIVGGEHDGEYFIVEAEDAEEYDRKIKTAAKEGKLGDVEDIDVMMAIAVI